MLKEAVRPDDWRIGAGEQKRRRRRFSPWMLVGLLVAVVTALGAGALAILPRLGTHAVAVNGNCTLIVPAQPLTAGGLATPYQLVATDPNKGACNEANADQAAFVQAAVLDPATGQISIYNPLVIDRGTRPAIAPVRPQLPRNAVIGIWFGFNGDTLQLSSRGDGLDNGRCVNGLRGSNFGQFAYCNAPAFFRAANQAIKAGQLKPPALGVARDSLPCPTVRDFALVDMDQSDNVTSSYLVTADGRTAQMNAHNNATLQGAQPQVNGSDNRLLAIGMDGALGCKPWMAPDLADPGQMTTALPLNELQAATFQRAPVALIPNRDPMVLRNDQPDLRKLNAYRVGVDQPEVNNAALSSTPAYCNNLLAVAPARIMIDARLTKARPSPDPAAANSLFTFLAQRFVQTFEADGLNCTKLVNLPDPISVHNDANGVTIAATINGQLITTPLDCNINGTLIVGCNGTTTINGQLCSIMPDRKNHQIAVTCPAQKQP